MGRNEIFINDLVKHKNEKLHKIRGFGIIISIEQVPNMGISYLTAIFNHLVYWSKSKTELWCSKDDLEKIENDT